MNYNKTSTKRRMKNVDSKGTKVKNKVGLTVFKVFLVVFLVVAIIGCSAVLGAVMGIIDSAPDISHMDVIPTGYSTTVLADDGETEIATLVGSGANREYVTLSQIPEDLQQAFVAIEDERFYEHNGIDIQGIARAGVKGVMNGFKFTQGGSTITQQLIKNNVLTDWTSEETFMDRLQRKIQEIYLSIQLEEQVQDKDWILENYLNTINLGSNTLGVQAASNKYFGKDVSELTLSECAVIAGITKNPYGYDPIKFPETNAERRELVLDAMLDQGYITKDEYDEAMADPVYDRIASYNIENEDSYNTYFVDAMIEDVLADLIEQGYTESDAYKLIYQGGLTIVSTQNIEMQNICDEEANDSSNYVGSPGYSFNLSFSIKREDGTVDSYSHQTMLSYYKKVNNNEEYDITYGSEQAALDAIAEYEGDMLEAGGELVEGSESIVITLQPQVAMTVIEQSTGEVKALVGGRGDKVGNRTWNRATDTSRQPGSTFKIIGCYAAALDAGGLTLATTQNDAPLQVEEKVYKNYDDVYHGWTTMREAITGSYNITTVKTLQQIGAGLGYEYASKFGFTTLTESGDRNLSLSLGGLTYGVTNVELTAAYAAIANKGEYIEPSYYTAVYDHEGNLILDNSNQERHTVVTEETAFLLTSAMQDVMTAGTGGRAYFGATMAQAGKSGTTTSNRDTLFAGYTPYYTCVIWGGKDDNSIQGDTSYSKNIWRETMARIHDGLEYRDFEIPSTIVVANVCKESGLLPIPGVCDSCVYTEFFTAESVPTETCDHHIQLDICSVTGLIANANCPDSQVVSKVFIIGSDPASLDAPYLATEAFLATTCSHQASNTEDTEASSEEEGNSETTNSEEESKNGEFSGLSLDPGAWIDEELIRKIMNGSAN